MVPLKVDSESSSLVLVGMYLSLAFPFLNMPILNHCTITTFLIRLSFTQHIVLVMVQKDTNVPPFLLSL